MQRMSIAAYAPAAAATHGYAYKLYLDKKNVCLPTHPCIKKVAMRRMVRANQERKRATCAKARVA